jgi:hypothetical protein
VAFGLAGRQLARHPDDDDAAASIDELFVIHIQWWYVVILVGSARIQRGVAAAVATVSAHVASRAGR